MNLKVEYSSSIKVQEITVALDIPVRNAPATILLHIPQTIEVKEALVDGVRQDVRDSLLDVSSKARQLKII